MKTRKPPAGSAKQAKANRFTMPVRLGNWEKRL